LHEGGYLNEGETAYLSEKPGGGAGKLGTKGAQNFGGCQKEKGGGIGGGVSTEEYDKLQRTKDRERIKVGRKASLILKKKGPQQRQIYIKNKKKVFNS